MNPETPIRTREGSLHLRILKNSPMMKARSAQTREGSLHLRILKNSPMMKARSAQSISKWIRVLMLKLLKSA